MYRYFRRCDFQRVGLFGNVIMKTLAIILTLIAAPAMAQQPTPQQQIQALQAQVEALVDQRNNSQNAAAQESAQLRMSLRQLSEQLKEAQDELAKLKGKK